jgi:SsrA-binding protein
MLIQNRKARFEYDIIKEYTAGIQLFGSEVRSTKNYDASISESFIYIHNGEVFIKGMRISRLNCCFGVHDELRDKKLLLNKKEIKSISKSSLEIGNTIIPLTVFMKNGKIKLSIAVAKGKKLYDKRQTIKERDIKIQTQKELSLCLV